MIANIQIELSQDCPTGEIEKADIRDLSQRSQDPLLNVCENPLTFQNTQSSPPIVCEPLEATVVPVG